MKNKTIIIHRTIKIVYRSNNRNKTASLLWTMIGGQRLRHTTVYKYFRVINVNRCTD